MRPMTTVLLTGFGPFPGAPFNPTGLLVEALACGRPPGIGSVRRVAHVFPTTYDAVDRELPALLARERPDVLLMFGLSWRARMLRIESRARNVLSPVLTGRGRAMAEVGDDRSRRAGYVAAVLDCASPRCCGARHGHAGGAFARCWTLSLQLSVLARGRRGSLGTAVICVCPCPPRAPGKGGWPPTTAVRF